MSSGDKGEGEGRWCMCVREGRRTDMVIRRRVKGEGEGRVSVAVPVRVSVSVSLFSTAAV